MVGGMRGSTRRRVTARTTIAAAANQKTTRQPAAAAIRPLIVRASRIPISRPLITVPTTDPRSCSADSDELIGTTIWATTEVRPTTAIAPPSTAKAGAAAERASAAAVMSMVPLISPRRSCRSPSGTSSASPTT